MDNEYPQRLVICSLSEQMEPSILTSVPMTADWLKACISVDTNETKSPLCSCQNFPSSPFKVNKRPIYCHTRGQKQAPWSPNLPSTK